MSFTNRLFKRLLYFLLDAIQDNPYAIGKGTRIHNTVIFKTPLKIKLGHSCVVSEYVIMDGNSKNDFGVVVGNHVQIKPKAYISSSGGGGGGGTIKLMDFVGIGHSTWLGGQADITIGRNTLIGMNSVLISSSHDYRDVPVPFYNGEEILKPIKIGEDTWIGANCVVLPGTIIGSKCVIGAGTVVSGNIPSYSIGVGNPIKIRGSIKAV